MPTENRMEFSSFLKAAAESLDISESQYEAAIKHYQAVGECLNQEDSAIAAHDPEVYPQGSFRLGTMIKPVNDADEYDLDLVCELKNLRKERVTQQQLKDMIGDRLKQKVRFKKMLEEKSRCWRLNYADSARFHMDILPAIPDYDLDDLTRLIGAGPTSSAILVTDRDLHEWQRSNPIGYAEWFRQRMMVQLEERKALLAESIRASVEDVPDYKVKTTLQRSIQILKRHRDIMFAEDAEDRPISIIISTLAARSYNNEADLLDALESIVDGMPRHIESRSGVSWVPNPVNPFENFADKWEKHPIREEKAGSWFEQVRLDLDGALRKGDIRKMTESLKPRLGDQLVNQALKKVSPGAMGATAAANAAPNVSITSPSKPWSS